MAATAAATSVGGLEVRPAERTAVVTQEGRMAVGALTAVDLEEATAACWGDLMAVY